MMARAMPIRDLNAMSIDDLVRAHLSMDEAVVAGEGAEIRYVSTLVRLLKEAQELTGYIGNTRIAALKSDGPYDSPLGLLGYLIFIEQIGKFYERTDRTQVNGPEIVRALHHFGCPQSSNTSNKPKAEALYALRCALAHEGSLFNLNRKHQGRQHRFMLSDTSRGQYVVLPKKPWNGDFSSLKSDTVTRVCPTEVAKLAVRISRSVQNACGDDLLRYRVTARDEFIGRGFMKIRQKRKAPTTERASNGV